MEDIGSLVTPLWLLSLFLLFSGEKEHKEKILLKKKALDCTSLATSEGSFKHGRRASGKATKNHPESLKPVYLLPIGQMGCARGTINHNHKLCIKFCKLFVI